MGRNKTMNKYSFTPQFNGSNLNLQIMKYFIKRQNWATNLGPFWHLSDCSFSFLLFFCASDLANLNNLCWEHDATRLLLLQIDGIFAKPTIKPQKVLWTIFKCESEINSKSGCELPSIYSHA